MSPRVLSPRITGAVATRVLAQLRRDHRTLGLLLAVPCVLMTLLWWVFLDRDAAFQQVGAPLIAVFPFIVMFLVTSVTTLAERTSGTLERLMTMPLGRLDFLVGYALAFGAVAVVQALLVVGLAVGPLGLEVAGPTWALGLVAVVDSLLGTALGLAGSALARTEFQAVQLMPAFVLPQLLLCGLLLPRDQLPDVLGAVSDLLPLSYAVDAMRGLTTSTGWTADLGVQLGVLCGFIVGSLVLGAATLRRRSV